MRPSSLRIGTAPIPFRVSFGHAAATREKAENVLVYVEDGKGGFGLGEGCPRSYVTGETVEGALAFITRHRDAFLGLNHIEDLRAWMAANITAIDFNPSAFCAVELALLDLFARQEGKSIEAMLGVTGNAPVSVTAVYGSGSGLKFKAQAALFALNGINQSKLKLAGDATDIERASMLSRRGKVRLDANNLWDNATKAIEPLKALAPYAWAIEEPVKPRDWGSLQEIVWQTGFDIILDESLTTKSDLSDAPVDMPFIPNLRVSKLGGLIRSLNILVATEEKVIVGAQVGETSILARAGLALARAAGSRLTGFEGAYAPILLKHDVVRPSLGFGRGGKVKDEVFAGTHGLGLAPTKAFHEALKP